MTALGNGGQGARVAVAVVMPARDEADAVAKVVSGVAVALRDDARIAEVDIVVVDDGSADGTAANAVAAGARVLRHEHPRGYGATLKDGIRATGAEFVCVVDADGTYPPAAVPEMLALMAAGADQVIGARALVDGRTPALRRLVKAVITGLAGLLAGRRIVDLNSGLRCVRRTRVEPLLPMMPDGFSFTTTLTIAGLLGGWDVRWHEISYARRLGESKFRPVRDTLRLLWSLGRAVAYFAPWRLFAAPAAALGAAAVLATICLVAGRGGWLVPAALGLATFAIVVLGRRCAAASRSRRIAT
jgi:glycosyltransferase involved in cell wall biosynthesis